jgi:hypothetical protein
MKRRIRLTNSFIAGMFVAAVAGRHALHFQATPCIQPTRIAPLTKAARAGA